MNHATEPKTAKSTKDTLVGAVVVIGGTLLLSYLGGRSGARYVLKTMSEQTFDVVTKLPEGYSIVKNII